MSNIVVKPRTKVRVKTERPRLHKVILFNDDYTPREFVVTVLKAEFRMNEDQAYRVMMTAHRRGACVVGRLHEGPGRDEGDQRDGRRAQQRLSPAVHDRARGIAGRTMLRWYRTSSPSFMAGLVPAIQVFSW